MTDLRTKTSRAKLKPRSSAYTHVVAAGRALAYRKRSADKPGRWMLRTARDSGVGYDFEVLGTETDLTFQQALEAALGRTRADPTKVTVADALAAWATVKNRTSNRPTTQTNTATRIARAFPGETLRTITARQIRRWMDSAVDGADDQRARMATMNRELAVLKAALTMAADDAGYEGARAWTAVSKYPKAESFGKRMTILTEAEEAALIDAAAPDLAAMLAALQMTGARYGEMRGALVGDLEGDRLDLTGKTGQRTITLAPRIAEWFARQAGNRPATAPLLLRTDMTAWTDNAQIKPVRAAVAAAGLAPEVTTYALRHGFISRAVARGVPIAAVADHCGTSVAMITASYAKYQPSQVKEWFA